MVLSRHGDRLVKAWSVVTCLWVLTGLLAMWLLPTCWSAILKLQVLTQFPVAILQLSWVAQLKLDQ